MLKLNVAAHQTTLIAVGEELEETAKNDVKKIVWVACRGEESCEGKEAILLSAVKTGNQNSVNLIRYKCTTCGKVFSVSF